MSFVKRSGIYIRGLIFGCVCIAVLFVFFSRWLFQPLSMSSAYNYEISRGTTVFSIAQDLHKLGWLEYPKVWALWARVNGSSSKLRAGEYKLAPTMTPDQILKLFTSGKVILHSLVVIEGSTFSDLRSSLEKRTDIQHTLNYAADADWMTALQIPDTHPEGQFFPDTYRFASNTTDVDILRMAQAKMKKALFEAWQTREEDANIKTPYQLLILASIVEKESANDEDRKKIAGVFLERLERGMRLQTDPTVIYGLGADFDGDLKKADLLRDGPYNTYTREGLPPTPIAMPGAASLYAAAHPEKTGALFFVATGKSDGSHYFSKSLQEHNAAVQRYLAVTRNQTD